MTRILSGTAAVLNSDRTVAFTGPPLSDANCPTDGSVVLGGAAYFIDARTDTVSFELTRDYEGPDGTVTCEIDPLNAAAINIARVARSITDYDAKLALLDANGRGLFYNLIGVTGDNDPGPGNLALDDAYPPDITAIYLDVLDANDGGRDVSGIIELWRPATVLIIRSIDTTAYVALQLSLDPVSVAGNYYRIAVEYVGHSGSLAGEPIALEWSIVGEGISIDYSGLFAGRAAYNAAPVGKFYASIDGANGAGKPTVLYRKDANTNSAADWSLPIPFQGPESQPRYDFLIDDAGHPGAGEELLVFKASVSLDFAAGLASSQAVVGVNPTATAVYSVTKNDVQFGTVTISTIGTVSFAGAATSLAAGDVLRVLAPSPRDNTLSRVSMTLAATR